MGDYNYLPKAGIWEFSTSDEFPQKSGPTSDDGVMALSFVGGLSDYLELNIRTDAFSNYSNDMKVQEFSSFSCPGGVNSMYDSSGRRRYQLRANGSISLSFWRAPTRFSYFLNGSLLGSNKADPRNPNSGIAPTAGQGDVTNVVWPDKMMYLTDRSNEDGNNYLMGSRTNVTQVLSDLALAQNGLGSAQQKYIKANKHGEESKLNVLFTDGHVEFLEALFADHVYVTKGISQ